MRFEVDGYEVEINAKEFGKKRMNKKDTLAFANYLTCALYDAADHEKEHERPAIAERYRKSASSVYEAREMIRQGN